MNNRLTLCDARGPLTDLIEKLSGKEGDQWLRELNKMLRKENTWIGHFFAIDRIKPFNPSEFIGHGWAIWKGHAKSNGMKGREEQDQRSLVLSEIDFDKVSFETCLKSGETHITGEEKLKHHAKAGHILPDVQIGKDLFEEEGQKTLEYLYKEKGITWFELLGTVLRSSSGSRYALYLYRCDGGRWYWDYRWLGSDRGAGSPSLVLAST